MDKKLYAIILAGGTGARMKSKVAKQFLEIGGKPILRRAIEAFLNLPFKVEIILVLPTLYKDYWKKYCVDNNFNFRYILTSGGLTRFHSVKNGLKYIPENSIVAIHDGVRPFISQKFLIDLFEEAKTKQAVIPVVKAIDSMRIEREDGTYCAINREKLVTVQTPQVFHSELLLEGYQQAFSPLFTDDASVVEAAGCRVEYCSGNRVNIKITQQEDLILAEAILSSF